MAKTAGNKLINREAPDKPRSKVEKPDDHVEEAQEGITPRSPNSPTNHASAGQISNENSSRDAEFLNIIGMAFRTATAAASIGW
jgi:hypothetical protein